MRKLPFVVVAVVLGLGVVGCGDDEVSSDEQARRAYLGLDRAIAKSLQLGFAGFNAASSANISPQVAQGDLQGALTVTGQVDQGASANKGMRLRLGLVAYSDVSVTVDGEEEPIDITYQTDATSTLQPELTLSLRDIPTGTFTGTLVGPFRMSGDLEGEVTLDLTMSGEIQGDSASNVSRTPGTTRVTGTATSGDGVYAVDVTL